MGLPSYLSGKEPLEAVGGKVTVWGRDDLDAQATTSARTRCP